MIDTKKFTDKLKNIYGDNPTRFLNESIEETGALIAGGSVLSAYANFELKDLDIYVNISNSNRLFYSLYELGYIISYRVMAPAYDQSFFRKNNILTRFFLINNNESGDYQDILPTIDVMILPDNVKPIDVVNNFDLSFCQIWFDGKKVNASNFDEIKKKEGHLRSEYVESYIKYQNIFIIKRMNKYKARGFTINIDIDINNTKIVYKNKVKDVESPEEWVVKMIYYGLLNILSYRDVTGLEYKKSIKIIQLIITECNLSIFNLNNLLDLFRKNNIFFNLLEQTTFLELVICTIIAYFNPGNTKIPEKYKKYILKIFAPNEEYYFELNNFLNHHDQGKFREDNNKLDDFIDKLREQQIITYFIKYLNIEQEYLTFYNTNFDEQEYINENSKCHDVTDGNENCDINNALNDEDYVIFISGGNNKDQYAWCHDTSYLHYLINSTDEMLYKCIGPMFDNGDRGMQFDNSVEYVKIPISSDKNGVLNGFLDVKILKRVLKNKNKIFYIEPKLDLINRSQTTISHTVSVEIAERRPGYTYVSANHCQRGSNILVYTIKTCEDDKCIFSKKHLRNN